MTKIYKINKHKIQSLLSDCTHKDLWMQVDGLLEALSDKEEERKSIHNSFPYGNDDCPNCKPKQEKCNHRSYNSTQKECKDCGKDPYSETNQEETFEQRTARKLDKDILDEMKLKQPISLKEAVALVLQENDCESNTLATYEDGVNKILKLIQSHIVKEVEGIDWELQSSHKVGAIIKNIINNTLSK